MELQQAEYILKYYSQFMNEHEKAAWKHWSASYKTEHSNMTESEKKRRYKVSLRTGWMSQNPEVLNLLKDGIDLFRIRTAERIFKENPEAIVLNNCPKCGKLARTPFAKQCRFCFHDWH